MPRPRNWSAGFSGSVRDELVTAAGHTSPRTNSGTITCMVSPTNTAAETASVTSGRHQYRRCARVREARWEGWAAGRRAAGACAAGAGEGLTSCSVMARSCRRPRASRIPRQARPAPRRSAEGAGRSIVRAADPSTDPALYAGPMTALEPRIPTPPSVRSARQWLIALAQSAVGAALGLLLFLIGFGPLLEEFSGQPPAGLVGMYGVDALIGVLATVSSGPLRFVPPGRLHTAAHLLLAASVGLSIWAVPAAALALYRLGVRRRAVLDVAAILLVAGTSMLALSIDARIRDAAPEVEVLAAMGVMVVLALIPLLIGHVVGTRHELLASLRERTDSAERERETARSAADAAEREAAALVREHEA